MPRYNSQVAISKATSVVLFAYGLTLIFNTLDAYNIAVIPITWLGQSVAILIAIWIFFKEERPTIPRFGYFKIYFIWGVVITLYNFAVGDYEDLMPQRTTLPYWGYVISRFLNVSAFISTIYATYFLLQQGRKEEIRKYIIVIGVSISLIAIYIYIAQIYGLPELPRTRMGTNGDEQSVVFTYSFHRAMGTFREPSHLAAWLVMPFFICLTEERKLYLLGGFLILSSIMLTGSMTGIIGGSIGYAFAGLSSGFFNSRNTKFQLILGALVLGSLTSFNYIVRPNTGERANLIETLSARLEPILFEGGMSQSNRDYIYNYVENTEFPLFGAGLGHANLLLSHYLLIDLTGSFLSLYLNCFYSLGVPGIILLLLLMAGPLLKFWSNRKQNKRASTIPMIAAYIAWLVMFSVASEEFTMSYAVIWALLSYELYSNNVVDQKKGKVSLLHT